MRILLVSESINDGDGMGNHIISMYNMFKENGYDVKAYAVYNNQKEIPVSKFGPNIKVKKDDIMILHYGIGFDCYIDKFDCRRILEYHNITPPEFFYGYDEMLAMSCQRGYDDLKKWSKEKVFEKIVCVSQYNRQDLIELGFAEKDIVLGKLLMPLGNPNIEADKKYLEEHKNKGTNVLFVGRISPHKKQEDVIQAFAQYQNDYDNNANLLIVGGGFNSDYGRYLKSYIDLLGVKNVTIGKRLSDEELIAAYDVADVFLCMSEHEGFCIPLIEAMGREIPVVAYSAASIMNTMQGEGVLLQEKNPRLIARWIHELVQNKELRIKIIEGQNKVYSNNRIEVAKEYDLRLFKELVNGIDFDDVALEACVDGRIYDAILNSSDNNTKQLEFDKKEYINEIKYKD